MLKDKDFKKNFWFWRKRFYKKIGITIFQGRDVLDVGCGDGVDSYTLSKIAHKVYGFDIEKFKEWKNYSKYGIVFRIGDAQKIPFKDNMFDGVYVKDVLHHVDNPDKALREIDRVTKKGAVIVIIEANRYNPITYISMTKLKGHEHFSREKFKELISKRFKSVEFKHFDSHFIPYVPHSLFKVISLGMENFFEKIPFINKLQSYNVAIVQK